MWTEGALVIAASVDFYQRAADMTESRACDIDIICVVDAKVFDLRTQPQNGAGYILKAAVLNAYAIGKRAFGNF